MKVQSLFLAGAIFAAWSMTSCANYVIRSSPKTPLLQKIAVAQLDIRSGFAADQREEPVKYPEASFLGSAIYAGLMEAPFLTAGSNFQKAQLQWVGGGSVLPPPFSESILWVASNTDWKALTSEQRSQWLKSLGAQAALLIHAEVSPSLQLLRGNISVETAEGQMLWQQAFRVTSRHILKDPGSPYLSEWEISLMGDLQRPSHQQELAQVGTELGQEVAYEFVRQWVVQHPPAIQK